MTQTTAANEREAQDGTVRGFEITESDGGFTVTPYTRKSFNGRRTFYRDDFCRFNDKETARNWGRSFRDNGWGE